jgi:exodeoxyribonuclease VII large subunit
MTETPFPERLPRTATDPSAAAVLPVSLLVASARLIIERHLGLVWVSGEISNFTRAASGHCYFNLKDAQAQVRCVFFRQKAQHVAFALHDGLAVEVRATPSIYEARGEFQLNVENVRLAGVGALYEKFAQLKAKLEAAGWFAETRKRPLPAYPRAIGIVTSTRAAALRDILTTLRRRWPAAKVVIYPTAVQGDGAAADIARAIRMANARAEVDLLIVGRGGGSIEDLWAFNEERVARAIVACPVPVVSAVGHEVDFTIADFVADLRAPTPSAAAEMVVAATEEFRGRIDRLAGRLRAAARGDLQRRRATVHVLSSRRGLAGFAARVGMRGRHAAELTHSLKSAVRGLIEDRAREYRGLRQRLEQRDLARRLASMHGRLTAAEGRLTGAAHKTRHRADARFRALAGRLENLSPLAVLGRGYAVCWNAEKTAIVRSASAVSPGDRVHVTLANGEIGCRVE